MKKERGDSILGEDGGKVATLRREEWVLVENRLGERAAEGGDENHEKVTVYKL